MGENEGGPKPQQPRKPTQRVNAKRRADLKRVAKSRRSKFKFFNLPAEIKNQIYEHTLVSDHRVHLDPCTKGRQKCHPYALSLTTSLLRTCRRVHKEAILILLRQNTFVLQAYSWMPECFFTNPAPLPFFSFVGHVITKPPGYYTSQTCEIYARVLSIIEHLQSYTIEIPDVNESQTKFIKDREGIIKLFHSVDAAVNDVCIQVRHVTRVTGDRHRKLGLSPWEVLNERNLCDCWTSLYPSFEEFLKHRKYYKSTTSSCPVFSHADALLHSSGYLPNILLPMWIS